MRIEVTAPLATLNANTPWVPVNYHQRTFQIAILAALDTGSSGTFKVQLTEDDPNLQPPRNPLITRAATTATVIDAGHGLSSGDSITVFSSGDPNLDGTYDITVVDANTYTYTVANTGLTAAIPGVRVIPMRVIDHATMTALTARTLGTQTIPVRAVRARVTTAGAGTLRLVVTQPQGGDGG